MANRPRSPSSENGSAITAHSGGAYETIGVVTPWPRAVGSK